MPWCIGHENLWVILAAILGTSFGWTFLSAVMHSVLQHDTWRLGWDFSDVEHDQARCPVVYCVSCERRDSTVAWLTWLSIFFPITLVAGAVHATVKLGAAVGRGPKRRSSMPVARVVEKPKK